MEPTDAIDVRFRPLIEATTEGSATAAIEGLLGGDAIDVARDVVRRELMHSPVGAAHLQDVLAEVHLRLMRKLIRLSPVLSKAQHGAPEAPIENLLAYVSVVAENACYAFLRVQYPERTRFRNRVRYAAAHHPTTSLVRDAAGVWRCETRQAIRPAPDVGATQQFLDDPAGWLAARRLDPRQPLLALLASVVVHCDRPIELDRLVDALAAVLGIADVPPTRVREDGATAADQSDPAPAISDVLEQRQALDGVWQEIVLLPPRQRVALLLNLRDPDGGAVLHMLPGTGVVAMAGIASALGLSGAALDQIWDRLPLDDLSIATQLGLTRQQVINLRKSARARLARRFRGIR